VALFPLAAIRDNLIMKSGWPMLAILALWCGGCARESAPPSPPAPKPAASSRVDAFGLPLVIVIKPPEVPKEIEGPLPPVKEETPKPSPPAPLPKGKGASSAGRIGK
jgi:hypothetical protein